MQDTPSNRRNSHVSSGSRCSGSSRSSRRQPHPMTHLRVGVVVAIAVEAFTEAALISVAARFMLLVVSALPAGDMELQDAAMDIVRYPVAR